MESIIKWTWSILGWYYHFNGDWREASVDGQWNVAEYLEWYYEIVLCSHVVTGECHSHDSPPGCPLNTTCYHHFLSSPAMHCMIVTQSTSSSQGRRTIHSSEHSVLVNTQYSVPHQLSAFLEKEITEGSWVDSEVGSVFWWDKAGALHSNLTISQVDHVSCVWCLDHIKSMQLNMFNVQCCGNTCNTSVCAWEEENVRLIQL